MAVIELAKISQLDGAGDEETDPGTSQPKVVKIPLLGETGTPARRLSNPVVLETDNKDVVEIFEEDVPSQPALVKGGPSPPPPPQSEASCEKPKSTPSPMSSPPLIDPISGLIGKSDPTEEKKASPEAASKPKKASPEVPKPKKAPSPEVVTIDDDEDQPPPVKAAKMASQASSAASKKEISPKKSFTIDGLLSPTMQETPNASSAKYFFKHF